MSALAIKRETRQRPVDGHRLSARPLMSEIMESIVGLPEEKRQIMVAAMSEAMAD